MALAFMTPNIHEVAVVRAGLEITEDLAPGTPQPPWSALQGPVEPIVDTLRLIGPGPVHSLGLWTAFPEHEPFLRRLFMTGTVRAGPRIRRGIDEEPVAVCDGDLVRRLFRWLTGSSAWPSHERQVFDVAHRRFSQTYERIHDEDRLIDAWIAFEALFLPKQEGELVYRAQMRIARFLGGNLNEREAIREQLRLSYKMRSNVVHGAPPQRRKPQDVAARTNETLTLLRRALSVWLDPTTDRSEESMDRALLT